MARCYCDYERRPDESNLENLVKLDESVSLESRGCETGVGSYLENKVWVDYHSWTPEGASPEVCRFVVYPLTESQITELNTKKSDASYNGPDFSDVKPLGWFGVE